jgi:hypothetical protein
MTTIIEKREYLRQRSDYTYKFNTSTGRHGWLRLTPAYSLKIVEELISRHSQPKRIFDPFCGTGTTVLSAVYHGHEGVTTDINPFLAWFARAKIACYTPGEIANARDACAMAISMAKKKASGSAPAPPIHNIERWWAPKTIEFLLRLRAALAVVAEDNSPERNLLTVAFCRSLIALSNAAFNHQSMSFKDDKQLPLAMNYDMAAVFASGTRFVLQGASENPGGHGTVSLGDSRYMPDTAHGFFDLVITSPPYANRMSYIRELRPYMYWLDFLMNGRDAGELDWKAIGGTWGIATSRLADWERPADCFRHSPLENVLKKIASADNKNGLLLSNYVAKYFDDMWMHFQGLTRALAPGAVVHYIVGNSTFYGTLVPTERLYAEMLGRLGFTSVECKAIRKRNSKKELVEFDVSGTWRK